MQACHSAIFGRIRVIRTEALADHGRQTDAGADEGHESQAVDVEGEVGRRQLEFADPPDDEDKKCERHDIEHEVDATRSPEAEQSTE